MSTWESIIEKANALGPGANYSGAMHRTMMLDLIEKIRNLIPYKIFSCTLTQEGTDAPVVEVLHNDTGFDWIPNYEDVGVYSLTPETTPLNAKKVMVFFGEGTSRYHTARLRGDRVEIGTQDATNTPVDDALLNTSLLVLLYEGWDQIPSEE